ncbi:spore germination protein KB [Paenibacillus algorifonticola]|uniref:Spore germination protein KB n=1 Tax=Paenibacillus algorifonticola TaxID=684063 RepID=A0A1I2A525_9BACL|nr:endospore germination permease [Paenibacillus algorifonticola]SFE37860.1 spore germination protein KB [Paenibacillus algorifonticola]
MQKRGSISARQMAVLVLFFIVGDMFWFIPTLLASILDSDAWIPSLLSMFSGLVVVWFVDKCYRLFPGLTLIEIHRAALGKWLGGLCSLFFLFLLFNAIGTQLRVVGDFVTTQMMPETPVRVIVLMITILVVITLRAGLVVFAKSAEIFIVGLVLMFILFIVMLLPEASLSNLLPVFHHKAADYGKGVLYATSFPFFQMVTFFMLFPFMKQTNSWTRDFMLVSLVASCSLFLIVIMSLLVLGDYMTEHQIYAAYAMAKRISIGRFIERVEAVLVISYIVSTYVKMSINAFAFVYGLSQFLGLREQRAIIFPFGLLMFGLAYTIGPNIPYINSFVTIWPFWDLTNMLILALAAVIMVVFKKGRVSNIG